MLVLLTPIGSSGDVHPFVGLGITLRQRGHTVRVITNDHFEPLVRRCGLEFVAEGTSEEFRTILQNSDIWHPTRGFRTIMDSFVRKLPSLYKTVIDNYVPGETVVVAHSLDFASRIAHDSVGIPLVSMHLSPIMFRSLHQMPVARGTTDMSGWPRWMKRLLYWAADKFILDPALAKTLNAMRKEHGLAPVSRVLKDWCHSPQVTLGMFPDWFAPPQPDWPKQVRLAGFPMFHEQGVTPVAAALDEFLKSGTPPIVFTPGSAMVHGRSFFEAAVDACTRLGRRGILLTRFPEQIPTNLPADVRHFDYAPLSEILPRCAALVHHGGIGTTAAGFAGGVPQIIMPMSHDQPDNAARVVRLGVGDRLMPKRFRGPELAEKLRVLLDSNEVKARCVDLAKKCAHMHSLETACGMIEKLMDRVATRSVVC